MVTSLRLKSDVTKIRELIRMMLCIFKEEGARRTVLAYPFSGMAARKILPYPGRSGFQRGGMPLPPSNLDQILSAFLKRTRGEMSYAEFARKTGIPSSTLHRLEMGEQSMTLGKLTIIMKRLNLSLEDVFGAATKKKLSRRD